MWKRIAPVYMVSRTALTCKHYRQDAQKPARKFCGSKEDKKEKTHRKSPKKAKPGAFWVLEGKTAVKTGCGRM